MNMHVVLMEEKVKSLSYILSIIIYGWTVGVVFAIIPVMILQLSSQG